jgi:DNA-binding beta-propeller fold protein YncE
MKMTMPRSLPIVILLAATTLFSACDFLGENAEELDQNPEGVYIANQGNFSDANGTVTYYDPSTSTVERNIIPNLGSIIQSLAVRGDRGYIMSNSADRIDVFDLDQHQRVAQITDIKSPRYMEFVNDTTAYVTNQSTGTVTIINLKDNSKRNIFKVGSNPEGLTESAGKVYVANHNFGSGSTVSVINTEQKLSQDGIEVGCDGPRGMLTDKQHEVWVFCTGNTVYDENWNVVDRTDGAVRIIDPVTDEVTEEFSIDGQISTAGPGQDVFFSSRSQAAYVVVEKRKILRFDTETNSGPSEIPIGSGDPVGAIAYSAASDLLYIGRTPGFESAGRIEQYAPGDSSVVDRFETGIAPAYIAFDRGDETIVL